MQPYKNLNGDSGVEAYEIQDNALIVKFREANKNGYRYYKYSSFKPGTFHLQKMKGMAIIGRGLGEYISKEIKKNYEDRYRQYE